MIITTKYEIGQSVYVFYSNRYHATNLPEDKKIIQGVISAIRHGEGKNRYEVTVNEHGYLTVEEDEIYTEKPVFENKYDLFFDQYPELDEDDRQSLRRVISKTRVDAQSRVEYETRK